jgi:ADP-ribose pyrophosphatase YjhB (NUDIX family)
MSNINKKPIHALARGIIIDKGQILLCQTCDLEHNFYFLPGGHIDHNESAKEALARELLEETGYKFKIEKFLYCLEHIFEPKTLSLCHNHEYNFIFKAASEEVGSGDVINKLEKHIRLVWVPFSQIGKIDLKPEPLKELIPLFLKKDYDEAFKTAVVKEGCYEYS